MIDKFASSVRTFLLVALEQNCWERQLSFLSSSLSKGRFLNRPFSFFIFSLRFSFHFLSVPVRDFQIGFSFCSLPSSFLLPSPTFRPVFSQVPFLSARWLLKCPNAGCFFVLSLVVKMSHTLYEFWTAKGGPKSHILLGKKNTFRYF